MRSFGRWNIQNRPDGICVSTKSGLIVYGNVLNENTPIGRGAYSFLGSSAKVTLGRIGRESQPALFQLQELTLSLFGGTGVEFEAVTM